MHGSSRRAACPAARRRRRRRSGRHRAGRGAGPAGSRRRRRRAPVSSQSRRRAERLLPGVPIAAARRGRRRPPTSCCSPCPTTRCARWSPAWPTPARGGRGSSWRTPRARTASACSTRPRPAACSPLALHPVMTFTGRPEDLDRLAGATLRRHRAGRAAPGRRVAGGRDGRRAGVGSRAGPAALPRGAHASARTTWSRWSTTRSNCSTGAGVEQPARLLAPLLSAALDNVAAPGRRRADRPGLARRRRRPWPRTSAPWRERAPEQVLASYIAHGPAHRRAGAAPPVGSTAEQAAAHRVGTGGAA